MFKELSKQMLLLCLLFISGFTASNAWVPCNTDVAFFSKFLTESKVAPDANNLAQHNPANAFTAFKHNKICKVEALDWEEDELESSKKDASTNNNYFAELLVVTSGGKCCFSDKHTVAFRQYAVIPAATHALFLLFCDLRI